MKIVNQVFYLIYGAVVLVLFLGALRERYRTVIEKPSIIWPISLGLMTLSSFAFFMVPYGEQYFLALANTSLLYSIIAIALLFRSWNQALSTQSIRIFWVLCIASLFSVEWSRQNISYLTRMHLMGILMCTVSAWSLYELFRLDKKQISFQLNILKLVFLLHLVLVALRSIEFIVASTSSNNVYQELPSVAILRLALVATYLLVYICIGNIHYERLWKKEEKKSSNTELQMLAALNALALARDNETGNHILRTQHYVKLLALQLMQTGKYPSLLDPSSVERIFLAAPLHDVGKVGIPDQILYKAGALNSEEWRVMKTHATIGANVLSSAQEKIDHVNVISTAIEIAANHHEQWDGAGYPGGLKGEDIPLSARIMTLADMYDALVSKRVYKQSWTHTDAVAEILKRRGTHFDPEVVDAFVQVSDEFEKIAQTYQDVEEIVPVVSDPYLITEHKLFRAEQKFLFLFEYSPLGFAMVDHTTGKFLEVNQSLLNFTGYKRDEFLQLTFWDITPEEYAQQELAQFDEINTTGRFEAREKEYIRKDGTRFPISIRGFMVNDVDGRKVVWGIIEDISTIKRAQAQEKSHNDVLEMLAQDKSISEVLEKLTRDIEVIIPGAVCSVLLVDEARASFKVGAAPNVPQYFSDAVEQLSIADGLGCCCIAVLKRERVIAEDIETDPNWQTVKDLVLKSGFKSCWSQPIFSSKGEVLGTFATYRFKQQRPSADDIRLIEDAANLVSIVLERKSLESKVYQMAFYDSLTNLPNRQLLQDRLKTNIALSKRTKNYGAVLFLDLDALKGLNDEFGHGIGDMLLIEVAKRLRMTVRELDTVARFGGDEYVVILGDLSPDLKTSANLSMAIAQKLRAVLELPYVFNVNEQGGARGTIEHRSTASIGCKLFLGEKEPIDTLLKSADMAMYRAKRAGGNRVEFYDLVGESLTEESVLGG